MIGEILHARKVTWQGKFSFPPSDGFTSEAKRGHVLIRRSCTKMELGRGARPILAAASSSFKTDAMARVDAKRPFYFGNAKADGVRGSGWFVGQFVPPEFGPRRQTDVELKWGLHPDGEKRSRPWANRNASTIAVLIEGSLRLTFYLDGTEQEVTLGTKGDYVAFGPEVVHSWEAIGDTIVLTVRFPSVEIGSGKIGA